jgi:hypothetical protein
MRVFSKGWQPEKDPLIIDLRERILKKNISLTNFFKTEEFQKLSPGIKKSLNDTFLLLMECEQNFWKFEEESFNHSIRAITLEACQTTIIHLKKELEKYKSAETLIFSEEKENLIKIIVSNFDKLFLK